jgi:AraC-like DNA-binding protein
MVKLLKKAARPKPRSSKKSLTALPILAVAALLGSLFRDKLPQFWARRDRPRHRKSPVVPPTQPQPEQVPAEPVSPVADTPLPEEPEATEVPAAETETESPVHQSDPEEPPQAGQIPPPAEDTRQYQYIQHAKEFIAENYAKSTLSLNEVGATVGLSASYLSGLFKEMQSVNFSTYLANYRVERSKLLLTSTDLSVNRISHACGFNSSQNYYRVFKKYVGMTPGQYRSEQKPDGDAE